MENLWRVSEKDYIRDEKEHLSLSIIRSATPFSKSKWNGDNIIILDMYGIPLFQSSFELSFHRKLRFFWTISTRLPMRKPQTILTCMYTTAESSGSVWCLNNAPNLLTKPSSACYAPNFTCILHWSKRWCSLNTRIGLEDTVGGHILEIKALTGVLKSPRNASSRVFCRSLPERLHRD